MEKIMGGKSGSSVDTIVMRRVHTAAKPSAKNPNARVKMIRTERDDANPHKRRQDREAPMHDSVTTALVGQRSLICPRKSRPITELALGTFVNRC